MTLTYDFSERPTNFQSRIDPTTSIDCVIIMTKISPCRN